MFGYKNNIIKTIKIHSVLINANFISKAKSKLKSLKFELYLKENEWFKFKKHKAHVFLYL